MDCGEVMCAFNVHELDASIYYIGDIYMHVDSINIRLYIELKRNVRFIRYIYHIETTTPDVGPSEYPPRLIGTLLGCGGANTMRIRNQ